MSDHFHPDRELELCKQILRDVLEWANVARDSCGHVRELQPILRQIEAMDV